MDDGDLPLPLPTEHDSVLISGDPGAGKSYLLGWFAEQVISRGRVTVVIDPEGDHTGLGQLADVIVLDHQSLLSGHTMVDLVRERISVVADLSVVPGLERMQQAAAIGRTVDRCRRRTGLPHWVMIDEAHDVLHHLGWDPSDPAGYCFATYRPAELPARLSDSITCRMSVDSSHVVAIGATSGRPRRREGLPVRVTKHVRHQHKYLVTDLSTDRGFHFRDDAGRTGFVARSVRQFVEHLQSGASRELVHHCRGGDLSRWFRDVYRDDRIAHAIADQERLLRSRPEEADRAGRSIVEIVERHYPGLSSNDRTREV